ncbi:MAG: Ger(x)C family spore germination protein [Syntrophomonadaceae bacterium]|nr:Ger(x)C family spore germination protein [Syntrophomonadaceae bacterium]
MRRTVVIIAAALLLLNSFMLCGCYNRLEVNNSVVVTGYGADIREGKNVFTIQMALPQARPEGGTPQQPQSLVVSETGYGWSRTARKLFLSIPRTPLWAMATVFIVGEDLARENIGLITDFWTRNRFLRSNLILLLARGASPEEVMQVDMPPESYSAIALEKMVRTQEAQIGIYTPVTLGDFLEKLASPAIEPVIPQVVIKTEGKQKRLKLEGSAVFKGHKMVGSLNEQETRGLRYMSPFMISGGLFTVAILPNGEPGGCCYNISGELQAELENAVTLELVRSQARIEPAITGDKIKMKIKIEAEGNLYEQQSSRDFASQEMIKKLEEAANQAIKKDIQACIGKAQLLNSDILGYGSAVSHKFPREWERLKTNWYQSFSRVQSEISVDFKIRRSYLVDKPFEIR